jgi:hypothetical protein
MIETLIGDQPLDRLQRQAIDTHRILDALQKSCVSGLRVELLQAADS